MNAKEAGEAKTEKRISISQMQKTRKKKKKAWVVLEKEETDLDLAMLPQTVQWCFFRPRIEMLRGVSKGEGGKVAMEATMLDTGVAAALVEVAAMGVDPAGGVATKGEAEGAGELSIFSLSAASMSLRRCVLCVLCVVSVSALGVCVLLCCVFPCSVLFCFFSFFFFFFFFFFFLLSE
jgi:hypothetical protein